MGQGQRWRDVSRVAHLGLADDRLQGLCGRTVSPQVLNLTKGPAQRKYSHTQRETISTGYRCPLYDGGVFTGRLPA